MYIEWPTVPMSNNSGNPQPWGHTHYRAAECTKKEAVMAAPFIFIATHKVKPGKLGEFQAWCAEYVDRTIEPNEPRLLAYSAYSDPAANEVTVVQVHPDAESMVHHMSVITDHVARVYSDFLERESRYQIYGTPSAGVLELIQQMDGAAEPPTSQEPFAGFTRLADATTAVRS
jgi:quinol monooxygenase YgiN